MSRNRRALKISQAEAGTVSSSTFTARRSVSDHAVATGPAFANARIIMRSSSTSPSKSFRGTGWLSGALLLAGVAALVALLRRVGVEPVWRGVERVGPGFLLVLSMPLVAMVLHCWAWLVLVPKSLRPRPMIAFAAYVASQAGDELGAGVAGEPLKALVFPPGVRSRTLVALALDNGTYIASTALLLAGAAFLPWASTSLVSAHTCAWAGASSLAIVLGAVLLILVAPLRRWNTGRGWTARFARGLGAARAALLSQPWLVLNSVLLHLAGKLWIVAEMALLLVLLGLSPALAPWLGAASVVASVLGAAIPGQMGAVEAAVFAACTALGVDAPTAMALVLLRRLRGGLWIAFGLLLSRTVLAHGKGGADLVDVRAPSGPRSAGVVDSSAGSAVPALRVRPILNTPWG